MKSEKVYIGALVTPDLKAQVGQKARDEGVTVSNILVWALQAYVTPMTEEDILIERAWLIAKQVHHVSISLLQRKLQISYLHAERIVEVLKQRGLAVPILKDKEQSDVSE